MRAQQRIILVVASLATVLVTTLLTRATIAQPGVLEEVIVTAQKRAQSAAKIGVTVTSFNGEQLQKLGIEKALGLAEFTPGLSTVNATSSGTPVFAIRGIGLDDFNSNNSSGVGVYIDGVLAPYPVFLNSQLFDIESVEILKGPQGTLYGKNTTGGAINFFSVRPSAEFNGYFSLGFSRWDALSLEGAVGGGLSDSVNTRLAFSANTGGAWQEDVSNGADYGDRKDIALRSLTSVEWGDDAGMLLKLHYVDDRGTSISPQNLDMDEFVTPPPGTSFQASSNNPLDVSVGGLNLQRNEQGRGGSVHLDMGFDAFTVTSITAVDHYQRDNADNYDGSPINTNNITFADEFDVYSQELHFTSRASSAFSWVAGLTYSHEVVDANTDVDVGGFFLAPGISLGATSIYRQRSTSFGAYLHTETELTEQLGLTLGLRYSNDQRNFNGGTFDRDGFVTGEPLGPIATLDENNSDDNTSAKVGLDYRVNDNWLLYANVATSYKAGVFYAAPVAVPEALAFVEQEKVLAYEAGFKAALLEDSLSVNAAAYRYRYDDRQSLVTVSTTGDLASIFATLGNIPESEIDGAELEVLWAPTVQLELGLGAAYMDARVSRAPDNIRGLDLIQPITEGDRLSQAPPWSYHALARYQWRVAHLLGSLQLQYAWTDKQSAALADANARFGSVEKVGLRASLEPADVRWIASAWVSNLRDSNSINYSFTSVEGSRVVYRQAPMNFGIEFGYHF